tara:strand:+ start:2690 stop:2920 length:231 start_codon:yes stop_codon:yes gene_type:complete
MVELQTNTKENKEKRKENDMSEMSWLSHLVTTDSKKELEEYLKSKGFRKPKFAAEQFLQAQKEIEMERSNEKGSKS